MGISNRIKEASLVTFDADFGEGGRTYFKKGESTYMAKEQAEKFKSRGYKIKLGKIDVEEIIAGKERRNAEAEKRK